MGEPTPGPWTYQRALQQVDGAYDFAISAPGAPVLAEAFGRDAHGGFLPAEDNARVIASAFAMRAALQRLETAAERRDTHMGDPIRLLDAKAELAAAAKHAREVLASAEGRS
mgnify:CR=1 FL=1